MIQHRCRGKPGNHSQRSRRTDKGGGSHPRPSLGTDSAHELVRRGGEAEHLLGLSRIEALARVFAQQPADYRPQQWPRMSSQFRLVHDDRSEACQCSGFPLERTAALYRRVQRRAQPP